MTLPPMSLQERLRRTESMRAHGHDEAADTCELAAAELDRLQARVSELEVDAERLDWLEGEYEREQVWLRGEKPVGDMPPSLFRSNTPITRTAIDTVRKAKPA